jgi:phage baseplate assembly protein W
MSALEPIGWPLLPLPDEHGRIQYPALDRSIVEQIQVILRTKPGEQLQRPGFGAGLENFLHEPNTLATHRRIRDVIAESLERWERRIQVDDIAVTEAPGAPERVRVEILYRIRRTGSARRTALTMELRS